MELKYDKPDRPTNKDFLDKYESKNIYGPDICRCRDCIYMRELKVYDKRYKSGIRATIVCCQLEGDEGREITLDGFCSDGIEKEEG